MLLRRSLNPGRRIFTACGVNRYERLAMGSKLFFSTEETQENSKKLTPEEVPHPHDFMDGDPIPQLRDAISNGPISRENAVSPDVQQLTADLCSLNMEELLQVNYLICKRLGLDPDILSVIKGSLQAGASAAPEAAAPTVVDSGFRAVILRSVPTAVKERFPIMKLMRAEDEKLSLADVSTCSFFFNIYILS